MYDQQILRILSDVGEQGIGVSALAKHIYNLNNTFFSQPDYNELKQYVQNYLLKNSKSSQSLIESTGKRGYYRLNTKNSQDACQLLLDFQEEYTTAEVAEDKQQYKKDLSLYLFEEEDSINSNMSV
jgi:TolA-binding protein